MISYLARIKEHSPDETSETTYYCVDFPDLPGCLADGNTMEDAKRTARLVLDDWLLVSENVPLPRLSWGSLRAGHCWVRPSSAVLLRVIARSKVKTMRRVASWFVSLPIFKQFFGS